MSEVVFKTVSLQRPVWRRLWEFKVEQDAEGLSHAVNILLHNNLKLKKIIERRKLRKLRIESQDGK